MEALNNIFEWLKTGWGALLAITGIITAFYGVVNTIKKVVADVKKPISDLKDEIYSLDHKLDDQTIEVNKFVKEEVHKIDTRIDELKAHDEMEDEAMKAMLRSDMLKLCEKYLKSGWATLDQKDSLKRQLNSYLALKGNSFIPDLVAQVMELPLECKNKKSLNE